MRRTLCALAWLAPCITMTVGCGPKRVTSPVAPDRFALPVLGTLVIDAETVETKYPGGTPSTVVKHLRFRQTVSVLDDGGLHVHTPAVEVLGFTVDGQSAPPRTMRQLEQLLPLTRPGFRVDAAMQFDGLVDFDGAQSPLLNEALLTATMEDRWRLATGGWQPNQPVGEPREERTEAQLPIPGGGTFEMSFTRTRLPDQPCVQQPKATCRQRRLESRPLSGPIGGELTATIIDQPSSHWPRQIQIERESRRADSDAPLKSVKQIETWSWEE